MEATSNKGASNVTFSRSGGDALKQGGSVRPLLEIRPPGKLGIDGEGLKTDRHGAGQTSWIDDLASCPVYYPTVDEFKDPLKYIQSIASEAATYGMCKVVSPFVASVPAGVVLTKEKCGFKFTTRTQPMRLPEWTDDDKTTFPMSGRNYSLTLFEKMANRTYSRKFSSSACLPARLVEVEFWTELVYGKTRVVEYACDVEGSAFSTSHMDQLATSKWNLKGFSQLSKSTLRLLENAIPGVTEPMLYIGMLFSMFAWHVEDHYLYSINYHHCGAAKTWYGVPGSAALAFEKVVQEHVYNPGKSEAAGRENAFDLLLGKTTVFPPKLLIEHGVPVFRTVQSPGFNCGEAVNFAMANWFPFGAAACQRYELLNRIPLLSHEELLCKEAMALYLNSLEAQENPSTDEQIYVKAAFVRLMQSHLRVQYHLKQQGALCITSNTGKVLCAVCQHVCYISYTSCNCSSEPCCFNHGEFLTCPCGSNRTLCIRENFAELEAVARVFEREDGSSVAVNVTSPNDSFAVSMLPVEELVESWPSDERCPSPLHALYSGSYDSNVNKDVTQSKICAALQNSLMVAKSEPCSPAQSEFSCILARDIGQQEESSDGEVLRLKRQRVSKQFQSDENGANSEVHQLCVQVENKEAELKATLRVGPSVFKEVGLQKGRKGQQVSRLIVRGPAPLISADSGKKEDGLRATDETQTKQVLNCKASHKGLDVSLCDPCEADCTGVTSMDSKGRDIHAGPVQCETEVEALESGPKEGLIFHFKVKQFETSLPPIDIDILQKPKDKKRVSCMPDSVPSQIADDNQADCGGSLGGHRDVCWLTAVENEACLFGDMGQDERKDDSTRVKREESDFLGDESLEEGELKEPSSMLDCAASAPHLNHEFEKYYNYRQSASNFGVNDVPVSSFCVVGRKSSNMDGGMESSEFPAMVNEEQKLWQAECPGDVSPASDKIEMRAKHTKHAQWHSQNHVLSQQVPNSVCPGMAQPSGYRSLDCWQARPDNMFTGPSSMPHSENWHHEGKTSSLWVPDKFSDKRQDQRNWYTGQRAKTTPLGNAVRSCKRWRGPLGSHFSPSSSTEQKGSNFFVSDMTGSGSATNCSALSSRSKSFHHHYHHQPKRDIFIPHKQPHFPSFQKKSLNATRRQPHTHPFWVNKGGAQGFQSSNHKRTCQHKLDLTRRAMSHKFDS